MKSTEQTTGRQGTASGPEINAFNGWECVVMAELNSTTGGFEITWHSEYLHQMIKTLSPGREHVSLPRGLTLFLQEDLALVKEQVSYWTESLFSAIDNQKTAAFRATFFTPGLEELQVKVSFMPVNTKTAIISLRDISGEKRCEEKILTAIIETESRERKRISHDLHDSVCQSLSVALLNLSPVNKRLELFTGQEQDRIRKGMDYLASSIKEVRNISHNLMPMALEDFGLEAAIETYIEGYHNTIAGEIHFHSNLNGERLAMEHEVSIFRIFQEALNNSVKHSGASRIDVQILRHPQCVILSVEDDGAGFPYGAHGHTKGFGLESMKNRTKSFSGTIDICSHPGYGTSVMAEFPTPQEAG